MNITALLSNPIVNLILGIVAGGIIGGYFYIKGKRDKEPCWAIHTVNLFKDYSGTVAGLEIQYLGEKVRDLSVSKVAFWNRGGLTINSEDLVRANPLCLETVGKGRILSSKLISANNEASQPLLSTSPEKDQTFLNFDYLDRGQGFVIQVIHEGTSSQDLKLNGVIKGASTIRKIDPGAFVSKPKKDQILELRAGCIGALIFLSIGFLIAWLMTWWPSAALKAIMPIMFTIGGSLTLVVFISGLALFYQLGKQVPAGLESFYTDPRLARDPPPSS